MSTSHQATVTEEPMVNFVDVTKSYGHFTVFDHLDLSVKKGEKVTIIGPSGSGKTTVLRVLMTLEPIQGGVIYVDGQPLTHMTGARGDLVPASPRHLRNVRSNIGMCFQHFNLFPHMTAIQNCIEAPIHVLGMAKKDALERAEELLEMVGLKDKMHALPAQLSGGQQQRVAIARALAMRPKVMLFDEVTSALDPEVIGEVTQVIRKMVAEFKLTMVMVTHQMEFAKQISDRVCFFDKGRIVEQGPPKQMFEDPKDPRFCQFLNAVHEAI